MLGHLPDAVVSKILSCCDFAFSRYTRSKLEKSGTFAAYAFSGLVVLTSAHEPEDPDADDLPVISPATWNWNLIDSDELADLRCRIRQRAREMYGWQKVAQAVMDHLCLSTGAT